MGPPDAPTALITGGAKGIGLAMAEALVRSGWNLVVWGRDERALSHLAATERTTGRAIEWAAVDLSESGAAAAAFRSLIARRPLPDALICNAGNYGVLGAIGQVDFAAWKKSFDLNFFSAAELVHEYVLAAFAAPSGVRRKIVVMGGSGLGSARVWPSASAYACAKAALYRLVEVVHEEVHARGIDINCLAPGAVKTGITDQAIAAGAESLGPLHRVSLQVRDTGGDSPAFVAEAVATLLSRSCDGLSGRLISAKWDRDRLADAAAVASDPDLFRLRRIDDTLYVRKDA